MKMILVVANDETRALIIKKLDTIFKCAFSFAEAAHGQQALIVLKKLTDAGRPIAAVISEFKMSPLSGPGLVNQMNQRGYGGIPVFFLSDKDVADSIVLDHCKRIIKKAQNGVDVLLDDLIVALEPLAGLAPPG